jgi:pimeloyl-ACP methyl ester carboxylesterase
MEFSSVDDLIGVLDATGVERAALVGLSLGGGIALDVTLAHPDRVWALAHVAAGVTGMPVNPYTDEQDEAFEQAIERGDLATAMEIDLAVWAPLGADDTLRELWHVTPDARGVPDGATPRRPEPANDRLEEVSVPTLVIVPTHDPPEQREVGAQVARRINGAQLVEVDSDHYLTVRETALVTKLLEKFLITASTRASSSY